MGDWKTNKGARDTLHFKKEWSLILRLPKEVIDFCDKFNTGQGNMYDTPIDFRKFSSGYLDGKCFGEQKRLQPARHASTI